MIWIILELKLVLLFMEYLHFVKKLDILTQTDQFRLAKSRLSATRKSSRRQRRKPSRFQGLKRFDKYWKSKTSRTLESSRNIIKRKIVLITGNTNYFKNKLNGRENRRSSSLRTDPPSRCCGSWWAQSESWHSLTIGQIVEPGWKIDYLPPWLN